MPLSLVEQPTSYETMYTNSVPTLVMNPGDPHQNQHYRFQIFKNAVFGERLWMNAWS